MRRLPVIVVLAVAACARAPSRGWTLTARDHTAQAEHAMVATVSPIATQVGLDILRRGGNAVDAAVAVGFALAVVHPAAGNIGGGGFLVVRMAGGEVAALDFRETAPAGATRDMYVDSTGSLTNDRLEGHLAAGVPGSVAGLTAAHARYGVLPLRDVMAPAVRLARAGFVVDEFRARSIAARRELLERFDASRRQFLPGGHPPTPGARLRQPDLARTLQAIADSGPRVFYEGYVADLIAREMERGGGLITRADLGGYRPYWRDPIRFGYRGHTVLSMPPASSGGVTLAMILNILERYDALPPPRSAEYVHLLAEAMRRAFVDRNHYLGDPAFVQMPIDTLVSDTYAARRQRSIVRDRATPSGDVPPGVREGEHTTHYSVVDAAGNAVAVTTTINSGFGSGVTVAGAGFLLNNEMDDFTSAPGEPNVYGLIQGESNAIAPTKRMLSAMTPTIVLDRSGALELVLGSPGGPTIITTVAQVISRIVDFGASLPDAVTAPRVHHQALPDVIAYEHGGLDPAVVARLEAMGHRVEERRGYSGEVAAIQILGGMLIGVADPRSGGTAKGY